MLTTYKMVHHYDDTYGMDCLYMMSDTSWIVGIMYEYNESEYENTINLKFISTNEDYENKGFLSSHLNNMINEIIEKYPNTNKFTMMVRNDNASMMHLAIKHGFKVYGIVQHTDHLGNERPYVLLELSEQKELYTEYTVREIVKNVFTDVQIINKLKED